MKALKASVCVGLTALALSLGAPPHAEEETRSI